MVSLYFHIPFCTKKCPYCHFYVIPNHERFHIQLIEGLRLEWNRNLPLINNRTIQTLYFGGGTPSLLPPKQMQSLLEMIRKTHSLDGIEITLEANPEVNLLYHEFGVNRLSFGVQSFDDNQLKLLGREHTKAQAIDAITNAGLENISIDLMYDLPHQTLESWERSLKIAIELPITHISLYNLTIEPHTVFFKQRKSLQPHLPTPEISLKMYEKAQEILTKAGFQQYEISAFAKPGFTSQHNTGYWTARPFLGFGPSAFSYDGKRRYRNIAHISRYQEALKNGNSPVDFEEELEEEAQIKEKLAIHLRLMCGVDLNIFPKLPKETEASIQFLISQDLLQKKEHTLSLTQKGILLYDSVATELI